jgi:hypothetical protein
MPVGAVRAEKVRADVRLWRFGAWIYNRFASEALA